MVSFILLAFRCSLSVTIITIHHIPPLAPTWIGGFLYVQFITLFVLPLKQHFIIMLILLSFFSCLFPLYYVHHFSLPPTWAVGHLLMQTVFVSLVFLVCGLTCVSNTFDLFSDSVGETLAVLTTGRPTHLYLASLESPATKGTWYDWNKTGQIHE